MDLLNVVKVLHSLLGGAQRTRCPPRQTVCGEGAKVVSATCATIDQADRRAINAQQAPYGSCDPSG